MSGGCSSGCAGRRNDRGAPPNRHADPRKSRLPYRTDQEIPDRNLQGRECVPGVSRAGKAKPPATQTPLEDACRGTLGWPEPRNRRAAKVSITSHTVDVELPRSTKSLATRTPQRTRMAVRYGTGNANRKIDLRIRSMKSFPPEKRKEQPLTQRRRRSCVSNTHFPTFLPCLAPSSIAVRKWIPL
jgi:hypothetical protein